MEADLFSLSLNQLVGMYLQEDWCRIGDFETLIGYLIGFDIGCYVIEDFGYRLCRLICFIS